VSLLSPSLPLPVRDTLVGTSRRTRLTSTIVSASEPPDVGLLGVPDTSRVTRAEGPGEKAGDAVWRRELGPCPASGFVRRAGVARRYCS